MKKTLPIRELFYRSLKKTLLIMSIAMVLMILGIQRIRAAEDPQQKQGVVSGIVVDESGNPLPGVAIKIEGTSTGVLTDATGNYSITLPTPSAELVFSFMGYDAQKIKADGTAPLNVKMVPASMSLNEVVVVGYGTQKRKDLTGAVAQVKSEDLLKTSVIGFDQAIQGKMAGVQVTNNSGAPGDSRSIRIRGVGSINGTNEPLYIIDGVPYGDLNAINVNDIERIDVLKDAAAASIYGSRASNGVVLVTTKRGQKGLAVSFDAVAGVQSVGKKIKLLNGSQFAELANENLVNGGMVPNPMWSNPSTVQDNDWQSALFQPAPMQNYNLNISGGGEKVITMFSFGYLDQGGIIVGSAYKRYTARLNTDINVTKHLKAGITLNGAFGQKHNIDEGGDMSAINAALYMAPTTPIKSSSEGLFGLNPNGSQDPNGNSFYSYEGYVYHTRFAGINYFPQNVANPVGIWDKYLSNENTTQNILASTYAELEVIKGLKIRSTMNLTFGNNYSEYYRKPSPDALTQMAQLASNSQFNEGWSQSNQWNWVNTISYTKSFGKHNISAIAGTDALQGKSNYANINTVKAPPDMRSIDASEVSTRVVSGTPSDYGLLSYFGRASYDYEGKYLISGTIRKDGSSNFGPDNKYGTFASGSIGWRISQENFMKSIEFINDLKLRASYGTVGNQNIPAFKYLSTYTTEGGLYQYTIGSGKSPVIGIYQDNFGDPNIHWEKSSQMDIGFDLSIMKSKLAFSFDYYDKKLEDLLGYFPVPGYTGVFGSTLLKNGFSMENKGIELTGDFRETVGQVDFSVGANFAYLDNQITKLTDNQGAYVTQSISLNGHDGGAITQTAVGGRIGTFLGYVTDGIVQNEAQAAASFIPGLKPGDRLYKDMNHDGKFNSDDRVALGNGLPKYTFGFNLKVNYMGFDVSAFFHGQAGVQIANMLYGSIYDMRYHNSTGIVNCSSDIMGRWTGEGTSNTLPRNDYLAPFQNYWFSELYIQNGSFLRLDNLQIGYSLKDNLLKKAGLSYLRFYLAGQNLITFSKYTGYDPEIGSQGKNVLMTGADMGRYPVARMISIGLNLKF
jgi:TonB-dependent starch-binding outer membrane protein SusC